MASIGVPAGTPVAAPVSLPEPLRAQRVFGKNRTESRTRHAVRRGSPQASLKRRPNSDQGRALEMLGRAVEYLVDAHVMSAQEPLSLSGPELEAVQMLMGLSREVFSECEVVVSLGRRLSRWAFGWRTAA